MLYRNFYLKSNLKFFSTSQINLKVIPNNSKSGSSHEWLSRHLNDPYVKLSKFKSYRARSAFKLLEIDDKYNILKPGQVVVECGAAPGAWTQVCVERINSTRLNKNKPQGKVIAFDLNHFEPVPGATVLNNLDATLPETLERILSLLDNSKVDVVLSDMAPQLSGTRSMDTENSTKLVYAATKLALSALRVDGTFLVKFLEGGDGKRIENNLSRFFGSVKFVKPLASRKESPEIFFLARNFVGIKSAEN